MGYDDEQLNQIAELATLRLKEYGFIIESRSKTDKAVQAVSPDVVAAVL